MRKLAMLLATAALLGGAVGVHAQNPVDVTATVTIPEVLRMDVQGTSITFTPSAAMYTGAVVAVDANQTTMITTMANVPHEVRINTVSSAFTHTDGVTTKSLDDLSFSTDGWGTPSAFVDDALVLDHATGSGSATVHYRLDWHADDAPGEYSATFQYTLVAAEG